MLNANMINGEICSGLCGDNIFVHESLIINIKFSDFRYYAPVIKNKST